MAISTLIQYGITAMICYLIYRYIISQSSRRKLPPGPKPLPIIGNMLDFPPAHIPEFQHWLHHKDLYGSISSVSVLGTTLILVHDKKAAHELLEQNSNKTSGRPSMVFATELCGYENIVLCQGYNNKFRNARKLLHKELGTRVSVEQFRDVQEREVNRQLVRTLNEPEKWLEHLKTTTAATVLKMTYDYTISPNKPDVLVDLIEKMMTEFSLAAVPMAWPVDLIPILRYLPSWVPGFTFQDTARLWRRSIQACAYTPYRFVRRQIADGKHRPSYVSKLLEQIETSTSSTSNSTNKESTAKDKSTSEDEQAIIWTAASLYGAAADTTIITLTTLTLALLLFPEVQQKAHSEIDALIGASPTRLPTFSDRSKLPYINALIQETLRWWPIAPMGFPHAVDSAFKYNGMSIPKGAILLPATWWFLHDPSVYARPEEFEPERFLAPRNEPGPESEVFGYGRRRCPGRWFADEGLWVNVVRSLAVFRFGKAVDGEGRVVEVGDVRPKSGILSYPGEFRFRVEVRSAVHAGLVMRVEEGLGWEDGDAELLKNEVE